RQLEIDVPPQRDRRLQAVLDLDFTLERGRGIGARPLALFDRPGHLAGEALPLRILGILMIEERLRCRRYRCWCRCLDASTDRGSLVGGSDLLPVRRDPFGADLAWS